MDPKLCKSGVFCTAAQFEKQQFRMEGIAKIEVSKRNKCIEIKKKYKKLRNCEFQVLFGACKRCG